MSGAFFAAPSGAAAADGDDDDDDPDEAASPLAQVETAEFVGERLRALAASPAAAALAQYAGTLSARQQKALQGCMAAAGRK